MKTIRTLALLSVLAGTLLSARAADSRFTVGQSDDDERTCIVLTSSARYAFAPPRAWRMAPAPDSRQVLLYSPDEQSVITLQFIDGRSGQPTDQGQWRSKIQESKPAAEPGELSGFLWQGLAAEALDLAWDHAGALRLEGRFLRLPVKSGWVEISLVSPSEQFGNTLPPLMQLVGSIRAGAVSERLAVRRLSRE